MKVYKVRNLTNIADLIRSRQENPVQVAEPKVETQKPEVTFRCMVGYDQTLDKNTEIVFSIDLTDQPELSQEEADAVITAKLDSKKWVMTSSGYYKYVNNPRQGFQKNFDAAKKNLMNLGFGYEGAMDNDCLF